MSSQRERLASKRAKLSAAARARLASRLSTGVAAARRRPSASPDLPALVPDPAHRYEPFPLNDIQQAYWLGRSASFDLGNIAEHVYIEVDCVDLDIARLEAAWQRLIDRHDMLRAVVLPEGMQQVLAEVPRYRIAVLDLRDRDAGATSSELERVREELSHQVLSPETWPLFDVRATRIDERRTRVHISVDGIVGDAWSLRVLFNELATLVRDPDAELPRLDITFRDYMLAKKRIEDTPLYAESRAYWHERLASLPPGPQWPMRRDAGRAPEHGGGADPGSPAAPRFVRRGSTLDKDAWDALQARAHARGLTPTAVLLTAFCDVVGTWSSQPHFCVSVTQFERLPLHPQVTELVGDFSSFLLLEVDARCAPGFAERARRVQTQLWEDMSHPYMSGVEVLRELARTRGTRNALMPVVFTSVLNQDASDDNLPILDALSALGEMRMGLTQTSQIWLDFQVMLHHGALQMYWDSIDELFPPGLIEDVFAAYTRLLDRLASDDGAWQSVPLALAPAAHLEVQAAANRTEAPAPEGLLHRRLRAHARERPEAPAVVWAGGALGYGPLHARVTRLARWLRQRGVAPGRLVAVVMDKGWEQVAAVLGILEAGGGYFPIDPKVPPQRLRHLLDYGEVEVALTQSWLADRLAWPEWVTRCSLDVEAFEGVPDTPLDPVQTPRDVAAVICTSGSTGTPKGVVLDHAGPLNTVVDISARLGLSPADRAFAITALHHDMCSLDIFTMLEVGGAVIMPSPGHERDPGHWAALIARHGATVWTGVPAFMQMLVEHLEAGTEADQSTSEDASGAGRAARERASLRHVMLGGDWIPLSLPDRIRALFANAQVTSIGGPTETSICSVAYPIGEVDPAWASIPYGTPLANQKMHILNAADQPCPLWVPGEIHNTGLGVARGYWRMATETAARFVPHPATGERMYRTGDLGRYLPDGTIEFLGRRDFQVKIGGHRVELGEIEAALGQHAHVGACVVVARGDARGPKTLVAMVVPAAGAPVDGDELKHFLRARLPEHMVPARFHELAELPLTANGKVDRAALAAIDIEARAALAPRSATEKRVAASVAAALGRDPGGIDARATLFELGADSIDIVQIAARLRKDLDLEVPMAELFQDASVERLAARLDRGGQDRPAPLATPIRPRADRTDYPLSFAQERLWFMEKLQPGLPIFNLHGFVRLRGTLDVAALERSWQDIITRHEVLRATFHTESGRAVQRIAAPRAEDARLPVVELEPGSADAPARSGDDARDEQQRIDERLIALCRAEARQPFDIAEGPLIRPRLVKIDDRDHALVFTVHHLVADAWSLGLLMGELAAGYRAHVASPDERPEPTIPPIQYADYAAWEREVLSGATLDELLSYWRGALADVPLVLELPTDRPRPRQQDHSGALHDVTVPRDLARQVESLARDAGATLYMGLLAGYAVLVHKLSGAQAFVIGSPAANRNTAETQELLGVFVNMLPLPVTLAGHPSFVDLLGQVRDTVVGAFAHQGLPFEKLVEALQPARTPGNTPIFQVVFQLDNIPVPAVELPGLRLETGSGDWGIARYDLALRLVHGPDGHDLAGAVNYRTALWDPPTIARMMRDFIRCLEWCVAHPHERLSALVPDPETRPDAGSSAGAAAPATAAARPGSRPMRRISRSRRRAIAIEENALVDWGRLDDSDPLPLVARPAGVDVNLAAWMESNRQLVEDKLIAEGAILFRGFKVNTVEAFRRFSQALSPNLTGYDERTSPRDELGDNIFSSTTYPADQFIHFHNGNSYSHFWPRKIWFGCIVKSREGGRTPIADCRKVLGELDPAIVERFEKTGVMYLRNFLPGVGLTWQETFQTEDRAVVEQYCRDAGIQLEWVSDSHLRTRQVRQAVATHPVTGERVWFNQAHLFHVSMLERSIAETFASGFADEDLPSNSYYGDGAPIEPEVLQAIVDAYDRCARSFDWEVGDVMLLDNMLVAHARTPFAGERLITVAFSDRYVAPREEQPA